MEAATPMKTNEEETYPRLSAEEAAANAQIPQPPDTTPGFNSRGRLASLILKGVCIVFLIICIGCAYGAFFGGYPFRRMTDPALQPATLKLVCKEKVLGPKTKAPYYVDLACPFHNGGMYVEAGNLVLTMIALGLVIGALAVEIRNMPAAQKTYIWMLVGGALLILGAILEITSATLTEDNARKSRAELEATSLAGGLAFDLAYALLDMRNVTKFAAGIWGIITAVLFIVAGLLGRRAKREAEAAQNEGEFANVDPYQAPPPPPEDAPDQGQPSQSQQQQY